MRREMIGRLEERRYGALLKADTVALSELLHPSLAYTHSTGNRDSKQTLLQSIQTGRLLYLSLAHSCEEIRLGVNSALVLGSLKGTVSVNGTVFELDTATTGVWVDEPGAGWRLFAFQSRRLSDSRPPRVEYPAI